MKRSTSRARSRFKKLQWVEQVDKGGCGIAALAMVLGTTYARIREIAPVICGACGINDDTVIFHFLAEQGLAVQPVWQFREWDDTRPDIWPPKPFAPLHLCSVTQTEKDFYGHFVCMDAKGVVYDPAEPEFKPKSLSDFHDVEYVAGIWAIKP